MKVKVDGQDMKLTVGKYAHGSAMSVEIEAGGEPYAVLSVNMHEAPAAGCFWLKSWSENEEIARELKAQGVYELTGRAIQAGYAVAYEARLVK